MNINIESKTMKNASIYCVLALFALITTGCIPTYKLVSPNTQVVGGKNFSVDTSRAWNKLPKSRLDIKQEENWTLNGPNLDIVTFIGGVESGNAIAKQRKKNDRQIPVFKSNMSPPELVSMMDSFYRVRVGATVFNTTNIEPGTFLGKSAIQLDYNYIGGDDVKRRGRSMLAVIDDRLYLMTLDGTDLHYFDAALPEFTAMVRSATLL